MPSDFMVPVFKFFKNPFVSEFPTLPLPFMLFQWGEAREQVRIRIPEESRLIFQTLVP